MQNLKKTVGFLDFYPRVCDNLHISLFSMIRFIFIFEATIKILKDKLIYKKPYIF